MKKLLFFTTIFAMAMVVLTGCKKDPVDNPVDPVGKTKLTLNVPTPAFKFDATTPFTVVASAKVEADLKVTNKSTNPAAATVPASVVIKAGTDQIAGVITGVAEGKSTITIAASDVELTVASVEVNVTMETPPVPEKVNVAISTTFAEVAPAAKIPFTVTAEKAVTGEPLVITVTSSNPAAATVPATVTIPVGETKISGEIAGVAAGEATITISSDKINATVASIPVTVKVGAATAVTLSIVAGPEVEVGMKIKFTVSTPVAPTADLTVNVSSNNTNATVPATVVIPAGKMSVQGDIAGAVIGDATITIVAGETAITTATANVSVVELKNIKYGVIEYPVASYAMVNWFKIGEVKIEGANNSTVVGEGPLANTFELELDGLNGDYSMEYDGDMYTVAIFADWNRSGKFVKVTSKEFPLNLPTTKVSGTFEIPESASSISVIRVICYFTGERSGSKIDAGGCGQSESGGSLDFTYTKQ